MGREISGVTLPKDSPCWEAIKSAEKEGRNPDPTAPKHAAWRELAMVSADGASLFAVEQCNCGHLAVSDSGRNAKELLTRHVEMAS